MSRGFEIGDKVMCYETRIVGIVEKFYRPTACAEQTMIVTDDGRRYHAPTTTWVKMEKFEKISETVNVTVSDKKRQRNDHSCAYSRWQMGL